MSACRACPRCRRAASASRRGYTLTEALLCIALVGVMLVAALHTVGSTALGRRIVQERVRGALLAEELMCEILRQRYADLDDPDAPLGPDGDEGLLMGRTGFDDVDDYDGWSSYPPKKADGTPMTGWDGWRRQVEVRWVDPANPAVAFNFDTGYKRITVTVDLDGRVVATLVALRTAGADLSWRLKQ